MKSLSLFSRKVVLPVQKELCGTMLALLLLSEIIRKVIILISMMQNHTRAVLFYNSNAFQISLWSLGWESPDIQHSVWKRCQGKAQAMRPGFGTQNVLSKMWGASGQAGIYSLGWWGNPDLCRACWLASSQSWRLRFFSSLPAGHMVLSHHAEALEPLKSHMLLKRHLPTILLQW